MPLGGLVGGLVGGLGAELGMMPAALVLSLVGGLVLGLGLGLGAWWYHHWLRSRLARQGALPARPLDCPPSWSGVPSMSGDGCESATPTSFAIANCSNTSLQHRHQPSSECVREG